MSRMLWAVMLSLVVLCVSGCVGKGNEAFPALYHPDSRQTLMVLGELRLTAREMAPATVDTEIGTPDRTTMGSSDRLYRTGAWERMPDSMFRVLGRVSKEQARQGIVVVVDYAGTVSDQAKRRLSTVFAPLRIDVVCQPGAKECADLDPQKNPRALPGLMGRVLPERVAIEPINQHELLVAGQRKTLSAGRAVFRDLISDRFPAEVRISYWDTEEIQPEYLHIRMIQLPMTTEVPHRHLDSVARALVMLAIAAISLSTLLRYRRDVPSDNPEAPRRLGLLTGLWGMGMTVAGWSADSLYFTVSGVCLILLGRALFFGQVVSLVLAWAWLLLTWAWSIHELGVGQSLIPRVVLPTLMALYLMFGGVSNRLGRLRERSG